MQYKGCTAKQPKLKLLSESVAGDVLTMRFSRGENWPTLIDVEDDGTAARATRDEGKGVAMDLGNGTNKT